MSKAFASEIHLHQFEGTTPKHPCVLQKKSQRAVDKHRKAEEAMGTEDIIDSSKPLGKESQTP